MRQKITSITQWWRLPAVCVLCHQYHREVFAICQPCQELLPRIEHACVRCRLPLQDKNFFLCGHCIRQKPAFDQVFCNFLFEEPLRTLLHEFKYKEALYLANLITECMLEARPTQAYQPDCLVPIPMHRTRLKERGFNHAAHIAKHLGRHLGIPYHLSLCEKTIHTERQASLDSNKRKKNLTQAFRVKDVVQAKNYKHITLVDDLMTTGSTVEALARSLKQAGVERVDVWCLARTPLIK